MRPAVSAETTRRSSGTSVPLPRTSRSISPCLTVSIHSVPRSTVGAAGRNCELNEEERASYERVAAVLSDTFRASSAVECMNSVLRMQQSRHKRMTQPMLDLKRLYWNSHVLKAGKRKGQCPYQVLGLPLPTFDFWELLQSDPAWLAQELSGPKDTP